jgi:hypothetical protein
MPAEFVPLIRGTEAAAKEETKKMPVLWTSQMTQRFADRTEITNVKQLIEFPCEITVGRNDGVVEQVPMELVPQFHCPDPAKTQLRYNTKASCFLGEKKNREVRERFRNLQQEDQEVWQALIGKMLQEGVSIDNMLINCDDKEKVLGGQRWVFDNWRIDQLQWCFTQKTSPPANVDAEFHGVPQNIRKFHETVMFVKRSPEICYALRTLIAQWLTREENVAIFQQIARKAGWCPEEEHRQQRQFVRWFMGGECPEHIKTGCESVWKQRFPRFFRACMEG